MSRYYQILCDAIRLNDAKKLKEIGDIIDQNIFSDDVRDFCTAYLNDHNFFTFLSKSNFDISFQDKLLNWIYEIEGFNNQNESFKQNYLNPLIKSVSKFWNNKSKSTTVGVELIVLNNTKLCNSIFIYLALSEGYIRTLMLPSDVREKFISNLITLAFNYRSKNPPANAEKIIKFFDSLVLLRDKGFTIENITEILMVQPVWTLSYINQFYDIFKYYIPKGELQSLIIKMSPIDWQYVTVPSPSAARIRLILDHVRNHSYEGLGTRAFNSM
ncbi:MAG: hypothetical protein Q8M40_12370, partial [Legionella sp.]|nr:hypothetical protein [Legionella sp.]